MKPQWEHSWTERAWSYFIDFSNKTRVLIVATDDSRVSTGMEVLKVSIAICVAGGKRGKWGLLCLGGSEEWVDEAKDLSLWCNKTVFKTMDPWVPLEPQGVKIIWKHRLLVKKSDWTKHFSYTRKGSYGGPSICNWKVTLGIRRNESWTRAMP